jgi:hypothetical protein
MGVVRRRHASAAEAFASLKAGKRVRARRAAKMVRTAARAMGLQADGRQGLGYLVNTIFRNNPSALGHLFSKSIKIVEVAESGDVVVFSDVYHVDEGSLEQVAQRCSDEGLPTTGIVFEYPRTEFCEGYVPEAGVGLVNEGYSELYRGCLAGLRFEVPCANKER